MEIDGENFDGGLELSSDYIENSHVFLLPPGLHRVRVQVGVDVAQWTFVTLQRPEITEFTPDKKTLPPGIRPEIHAAFHDASADIDAGSVRLYFADKDVTAQAQILLSDRHNGTVRFTPADALSPGNYSAELSLANSKGASRRHVIDFTVDTPELCSIEFVTPAVSSTVTDRVLDVEVLTRCNKSHIDSVAINGDRAAARAFEDEEARFHQEIRLHPGANAIQAVATFENGLERKANLVVTYAVAPTASIQSSHDSE